MSDPVVCLNAALEGRYKIERMLGEGGMATVYLAEDLADSTVRGRLGRRDPAYSTPLSQINLFRAATWFSRKAN